MRLKKYLQEKKLKDIISKKAIRKHMKKAGLDLDKHEKVLKKRMKDFKTMKKMGY